MAIAWPKVITDKGGIRNQFAHVIDIAADHSGGCGHPRSLRWWTASRKARWRATSLVYTFDAANADEPSHHRTQYFEMFGNYALYHEGWMAGGQGHPPVLGDGGSGNPDPAERRNGSSTTSTKDWTQNNDLAAQNPEKVKELEAIWWQRGREVQRAAAGRLGGHAASWRRVPRVTAGRTEFSFPGRMTGISNGVAPSILNASYTFTAEVTVPEGGGDGMIITQGGRFARLWLLHQQGQADLRLEPGRAEADHLGGPEALPAGKHTLVFDFKYDGLGAGTLAFNDFSGIGQAGTGEL